MIPKGCTALNSFHIPYNAAEIAVAWVTYVQAGAIVLDKTTDDCIIGDGIVTVNLSQEDTLKLKPWTSIQIQIRIRLHDGRVTKSKIFETTTDRLLKEMVI